MKKRIVKKTGILSLGQLPYNDQNGNIMIENNPKANIMKYIKDIRDVFPLLFAPTNTVSFSPRSI